MAFPYITIVGVGAAAGTAVLAGALAHPEVNRFVRPALKAGLKGMVRASSEFRRQAAEVGEAWEDLVAEVDAEIARETEHGWNGEAKGKQRGRTAAAAKGNGTGRSAVIRKPARRTGKA